MLVFDAAAPRRTSGDRAPDRVHRPRSLDLKKAVPHTARHPCRRCNTSRALLIVVSNQATVRCQICHIHLYNAPKTETGQRPRTVKTLRRSIRPSQQARILNRDRGRCVLCASPHELTIGHLLSIEDGARLGATETELYSDANLAAMCEACNIGLRHGSRSITPRTYAVLLWHLIRAELQTGHARRPERSFALPRRRRRKREAAPNGQAALNLGQSDEQEYKVGRSTPRASAPRRTEEGA